MSGHFEGKFIGTFDEYHNFIKNEYFLVCKNSSVIEIGGQYGFHSQSILEHNPKNLEIIECDEEHVTYLRNLLGDRATITFDDAQYALVNHHHVDVVVCFGVLYHLHSPLHLLELIVNVCDPKYIILDTVKYSYHNLDAAFGIEKVNTTGMQQTRPNFKYSGFYLMIDEELINTSLRNMGYDPIRIDHIDVTDNNCKSNIYSGMWKQA